MSPLPTFADSRGVGVSGMPTSAIFEEKSLNYCNEYLLFVHEIILLVLIIYLFFLLNYCIEYLVFVIRNNFLCAK